MVKGEVVFTVQISFQTQAWVWVWDLNCAGPGIRHCSSWRGCCRCCSCPCPPATGPSLLPEVALGGNTIYPLGCRLFNDYHVCVYM